MFETVVIEKIETHILYLVAFFLTIVPFVSSCGKMQ